MTATFESLAEQSARMDETKWDVVRTMEEISFTPDYAKVKPVGDLLFSPGEYPMTDWALQQMCQKLGEPPFSYMKACPEHLRAINLEYWRKTMLGKKVLLRGNADMVRGVLSEQYVPISNTWIIESVSEMISEGVQGGNPYSIVTPWLTPDSMQLRVALLGVKDVFKLGVYISNGEIGNTAVKILPFVQRTSCENSFLFLDGGMIQRHWRISPPVLKVQIKTAIGESLRVSSEYLATMAKREEEKVDSVTDVIADLCTKYGFSQEMHDLILLGTEGHETVMGVANGVSYAAHHTENFVVMEQMESLAGFIIQDPKVLVRSAVKLDESDE